MGWVVEYKDVKGQTRETRVSAEALKDFLLALIQANCVIFQVS